MADLDEVIHQAGGFGRYQIVLVTVAAVFMGLVGANMAASVFEAMVPDSRCKSPFADNFKEICPLEFQSLLVPEEKGELSKCIRYNFTDVRSAMLAVLQVGNTTSNCSITVNETNVKLVKCTEWEYDQAVMRSTIVTDFDLVCGDQWAGYLSQSALMLGVGIGSAIFGYISDRIGRRHAFLLICFGGTITGTASATVQSYLTYSVMRSIVGLFVYSSFPILFVLASELTTSKYRSVVAQALELAFPLGFLYLSLSAHLLRDWRHLQLAISVPFASGILLWWFLPESPRWLFQKGRREEAQKVIESMARVNGANQRTSDGTDEMKAMHRNTIDDVEQMSHKESNRVKSLFQKPHLRSASLKMFYNWFAVSCVYYGLTLNAAELDGDPFRNLCLVAVAEIIAIIFTVPLVQFCGRRATGCASGVMAGLMCVLTVLIPTGLLPIALLGKFAISISFSTMYIHANEIYPTAVRNLGIGLCSAMARVGGIVSPIIAMSGLLMTELPYAIFGILSIIGAIFVLTLPETNGVELPETIEEGENFVANNRGIRPTFRKKGGQLN